MLKIKNIILIAVILISIVSIVAITSYADSREKELSEASPYILKVYDNSIAAYKNDKVVEIFDSVNYSALPEYDRNQLKKGISFDTIDEIYIAVEDYDG